MLLGHSSGHFPCLDYQDYGGSILVEEELLPLSVNFYSVFALSQKHIAVKE